MPWSDEPGGGFTTPEATPWLAFGDLAAHQRRRSARGPGLDAPSRARPDRAAARAARPDRGRLRLAAGARRRVGLDAAATASPSRSTCRTPTSSSTASPDGSRSRTDRARDGEAVDGAIALGPCEGAVVARWMTVDELAPLLSEEGWAYASLPPQEPGDPGRFHALFGRDSLITALQVLPAAPEVARATLRALAALQGTRRRPGDRRGAGQDPARVPAPSPSRASPRRAGRCATASSATTAARTRRAGSSSCSPRSTTPTLAARARDRRGAPPAAWLAGALDAGGGLVRYGPRRATGGLAQQGWRDAIAPVEHHPDGRRHRPRGRGGARRAARRRRLPGRGGRGARRARAARPGRRLAGARRRAARRGSPAGAARCWRSRPTGRRCRAPARSSAGCCGPARSTERGRGRRRRAARAGRTC